MAEGSHRVTVIVALIGLLGTLGAALLGNWDRVFPRAAPAAAMPASGPGAGSTEGDGSPVPADERRTTPTPASTTVSIAGVWSDRLYPGITSRISQRGARFDFVRGGPLPDGGGRFESEGSGRIDGSRVESRYRTRYADGTASSGSCLGTVDLAGTRMDLFCDDTLLGSFPVRVERR